MRRILNYLPVFVLLVTLIPPAAAAGLSDAQGQLVETVQPESTDIQVLRSDSNGLELRLVVDEPVVETVHAGGDDFLQVSLPGYDALDEAGQPALPERGFLLGVPPDTKPQVTVVDVAWQVLPGDGLPLPAPTYEAERDWDGTLVSLDGPVPSIVPSAAYYEMSVGIWPDEAAVMEETAWLRGQQVARLAVRPVRWNRASGHLEVARTLHLRVDFAGRPARLAGPALEDAPYFEDLLRSSLLNYTEARAWRQDRQDRPELAGRSSQPLASGQAWWKIAVDEDGLYALTPADLLAAGLDLSAADPRYLQLWDAGRQIALLYQGNQDDGAFDGDDRLLWPGQRSTTRYTAENVYWLTVGSQPGLRAGQVDGSPSGAPALASYQALARFEDNKNYIYDAPYQEVPDRWYGDQLSAGAAPSQTVSLTLDAPAGGGAELTLRMLGVSYSGAVNPDHHVQVTFNGQPVGDLWWDGRKLVTATLAIDGSLLRAGDNQVLLAAPGDTGALVDASHLDWLELRYPREFQMPTAGLFWSDDATGSRTYRIQGLAQSSALALDITDPWDPQFIESLRVGPAAGGGWVARFSRNTAEARRHALVTPDQLRSPARLEADQPAGWDFAATGADYLVISHREFMAGIQPLVDWRAAHGMRTALVDVQDVYDAYSDGQMDSAAIKAFLQDAYDNWPRPAPSFVLLAGNGHYDFQNFLGYDASKRVEVYIPPMLGCFDPWLCEVASDNRYVTLSGDDVLADMFIGRLPVRNTAQLSTVVGKILNYEQSPPGGQWQRRSVFLSDNTHNALGQLDPASVPYDFETLNERVIAMLPADFIPRRVYFDPYPTDDAGEAFRYRLVEEATAAYLAQATQGAFLFNYVGHAATNALAHEWLLIARGRRRDDLPQIQNGSKLAIGLTLACLSGNFADPTYKSLDAEMLLLEGGGTVASWGATGFGVATGHDWLHQGFYDALFNQGQTLVGAAVATSKLDLYTGTASHRDLIDTFVLLADPATSTLIGPNLRIDHAPPAGPLAPGDTFSYVVSVTNAGASDYPAGLQLAVDLPPLAGLGIASSGPSVTATATAGVWTLGVLPAGSSSDFTVTGTVVAALADGEQALRARARLLNGWRDRNPLDNETAWAEIPGVAADLRLQWRTEQALIAPGALVTATLSYSNTGPAATASGQFTLTLPANLQDIQVAGEGLPADPAPGAVLTWTRATLPAGESHVVTISGLVALDANLAALDFTAQGSHGWLDANPADNAASLAIPLAVADAYEPDDTMEQATPLDLPARSAGHSSHRPNDQDWFSLPVRRGAVYHIRTENLSDDADTVLSLYDSQAVLVAKNDDYTPGSRWSGIDWKAPADGIYYLMATGWSPSPAGYRYDLVIDVTYRRHLPLAFVR